MAVQITIIGLGQIGASLGLALASQKEQIIRVGHDIDSKITHQAQQIGAIDRGINNLHNAVEGAGVVFLSLPVDQIQETMKLIGPDLREGAVVMDTAPVKNVMSAWIKDLLPNNRHYVGMTPVINPAYLLDMKSGIGSAHADLFQKGLIGISAPPDTGSEAIQLASDLAHLVGATPFFADPLEMDGIMASVDLLPQLLSAALVSMTVDQPGWRDGRKIAGKAYAQSTSPVNLPASPAALASTAIHNRDNITRLINGLVEMLLELRDDLTDQDQAALSKKLEKARVGQAVWWSQRQAGDWASEEYADTAEMPKPGDMFGRLFGMKPRTKK
jgi:prephenate dehydrogenase